MQFRGRAPGFHKGLSKPPACALRPVIPNNACALRLTAAAGTELAGASFGGTVNRVSYSDTRDSSPLTVVYTPKGFLPHAASLRQSFDHCAIFPTAASRRSLGRISVPMWRIVLSDPLRVIALVSRYLTNKLIRRDPLIGREHASRGPLWSLSQEKKRHYAVLARVSPGCPSPKDRLVTCYSPVRHSAIESKLSSPRSTCMC